MTETRPDSPEPAQIADYLSAHGWTRHGEWRGATVWQRTGSGQLLIPDRREYPDDEHLLRDAVCKLAKVEDRPESEIWLDITEPAVDTQFFHTFPETPSGTIPLTSGLKALQGVHDLMMFAARTIEEGPHLLFEGKRSTPVDEFLQRIRLGTTRPGSYILTARVPVFHPNQQQSLLDDGLSGRNVLLKLQKAIFATHEATARATSSGDQRSVFDDTVEEGVSANLCEALSRLGGASRDRRFEIRFSWAPSQPAQAPDRPVTFTEPMTKTLVRAAKELEQLARSGDAAITGTVQTLHMGNLIKISGVLTTSTGETRRSVWVVVGPTDYHRAFQAQAKRQRLRVSGRLRFAQNRVELQPSPGGLEFLQG